MISNQDISNRIYQVTHHYNISFSEIETNISNLINWVFITLNDWDALHIVDYLPFLYKKCEEEENSFPKDFFWKEMGNYKNENPQFYTSFLYQLIVKNHRSGEAPSPLPFTNDELLEKAIANLKETIERDEDYLTVENTYITCWKERRKDAIVVLADKAHELLRDYIESHTEQFLEKIFRPTVMYTQQDARANLFPFLYEVFGEEADTRKFLTGIYSSPKTTLNLYAKKILLLALFYLNDFTQKRDTPHGFVLKLNHSSVFFNEKKGIREKPNVDGLSLSDLEKMAGINTNPTEV